MYAAEEVARFLHSACRGLPCYRRSQPDAADPADRFYTLALEYALAYFASRVLYPARPSVRDGIDLSRAGCDRLMESALRGDRAKFDGNARQLGYAIGSDLYDRYLQGDVARSRLRRLFLTHLEAHGAALELCLELAANRYARRKGPYPDHRLRRREARSFSA